MVRVTRNEASYKACAKLFTKYQMAVHNEPPAECDEKAFCEFLIDTPLKVTFFCSLLLEK